MSRNTPVCHVFPKWPCLLGTLAVSILVLGSGQASAQEQKFVIMAPAPPAPAGAVHQATPRPRHRVVGQVRRLPLTDKFVLSTDQLFEPSKDRLTEAGEAKLKALVPSIKALGVHPVEIVAHSDSMGFESYNQDLTKRLAERVKGWLVAHGVARAAAIAAVGAGSSRPLVSETQSGHKANLDGQARNRRVEILIDCGKEVEPEQVATKVTGPKDGLTKDGLTKDGPANDGNQMVPLDVPSETQQGLVDSSDMKPCTEADLSPDFTPTGGEEVTKHNTNKAEWGTGGTDFGNSVNGFGAAGSFGGNPVEINADGKRVVKITPTAEKQEQQRKDTIEAQNEFGLWRDP